MGLVFILPGVGREEITPPSLCAYEDCQGTRLRLHQQVAKALNDTAYPEVAAHRYQCLTCGRTFRVYPRGVSSCQTSLRVKRLAVMFYYLGLSYGAASIAMQAFGVYVSKSQVYGAVQEVARTHTDLRREAILEQVRTPVPGSDVLYVKSGGEWLSLELTANDAQATVLALDAFSTEDTEKLATSIAPIVEAIGAELLVSDGAGVFERVTDCLGLDDRVCLSHLRPETEALPQQLKEKV